MCRISGSLGQFSTPPPSLRPGPPGQGGRLALLESMHFSTKGRQAAGGGGFSSVYNFSVIAWKGAQKISWHLLAGVIVLALVVGLYSLREYRWDEPWLRPFREYEQLAVRIEGCRYGDPPFKTIESAFLGACSRDVVHGFRPNDFFSDSTSWPASYAWVKILGHMDPKDQQENIRRIKRDVVIEIGKTGLKVPWRFAYIRRDGSVYYPD